MNKIFSYCILYHDMSNIYDYLKEDCYESFDERELTSVDSLALSFASYYQYNKRSLEGLNSYIKEDVKLKDILFFYRENQDYLFKSEYEKALFFLVSNKRFENIKVNYYSSILKNNPAVQFSAITYFLDEKRVYIAFRGSDGTIVGYKEDLEMSFSKSLKGQRIALDYLNSVLNKLHKDSIIYIGGHSKGGNFAKYAYLYTSKENKERIKKVFDHDGPGFLEDINSNEQFIPYLDKIDRTVPTNDMVGLLLNNPPNKNIIKTSTPLILNQHFPQNWLVENKDFVYANSSARASKVLDKSIHTWLESISTKKRKEFVDLIFNVFEENNISSVEEFKNNGLDKLRKILKSYSKVSKEDKRFITITLLSLFRITAKTAIDNFRK